MAVPNVTFIRPEIARLRPLYKLIRDVLSGDQRVKSVCVEQMQNRQSTRAMVYLPMPNPDDQSAENKARYESYLARATFYNFTSRTVNGLVGEVFKQDPDIEVTTPLQIIESDANGAGVSLIQQAKKAMNFAVSYGRGGLLVDFPRTSGPVTQQQIDSGDIRPVITLYSPLSVINWRTTYRGAREILSLVVICEPYQFGDDGFEVKSAMQVRSLYLDRDGNVRSAVFREKDPQAWDGLGIPQRIDLDAHDDYPMIDASGAPLREIPFRFFGSMNNDSSPDNPPIYDMASLNIAHFRNSADYEELVFTTGQVTPWASGLSQSWIDDVLGGAISLGGLGGLPLPKDGQCGLLQAEANSMAFEAMEHKEKQAVALGAKLVESRQVARTLGEARLDRSTETSILASAAHNVESAYQWALETCALYTRNSAGTISFKFTTDFNITQLSPQDREQTIKEWQQGAITFGEMRHTLKRSGVATEDDDKARELIIEEMNQLGNAGVE